MKFLIILILSAACLNLVFASGGAHAVRPSIKSWISSKFAFLLTFKAKPPTSFKESTVSTPAFDARRELGDDVINKLPPAQREIMFSLLAGRLVQIGDDESVPSFMEKVATRQGYEQLISERRPLTNLEEERSVFGLDSLWKVNLHEVMPQTATLTDEDHIVSTEYKETTVAIWSVLNLVAMGYEDVIEVFKSSDHTQIREILFNTLKNLYLKHGKKELAQHFSKRLHAQKALVQEAHRWLESSNEGKYLSMWGNEFTKEELANVEVPRLEKEIAAMEDIALIEILADRKTTMAILVDKADAIVEFMANAALWEYDDNVDWLVSNGDELIEDFHEENNKVNLAAIADLGLYGWCGLFSLFKHAAIYYNFFEFLAQEVEAGKTLKPLPSIKDW